MAIKIYRSTRFGIANRFLSPLKSRSQPITRLTSSLPATRAMTPILFALGPWSMTQRLTVPSIACHVSTPSGLPSGTRCGSSSTSPNCIRSMRFRAFAACASFDRSGVQLPWVLGLDLRLNFMRLCYCVVVQRIDAHHASEDFGGDLWHDGVAESAQSVHPTG